MIDGKIGFGRSTDRALLRDDDALSFCEGELAHSADMHERRESFRTKRISMMEKLGSWLEMRRLADFSTFYQTSFASLETKVLLLRRWMT